MYVYEKTITSVTGSKEKQIFGTFSNSISDADKRLNWKDDSGNTLSPAPSLSDYYYDDTEGGMYRKSDSKKVNAFIESTNVIPGDFVTPTAHGTVTSIANNPYLYNITYTKYDTLPAKEHYDSVVKPSNGACSSFVHKHKWAARNLDWYYDNEVEMVIQVPAINTTDTYGNTVCVRHGSVGVVGCVPSLMKTVVDGGTELEAYKYLPYATVDGINDAGVYVNTNIVLPDYGIVKHTNSNSSISLCTNCIIRLILDNANSAKDALNIFKEYDFYGVSKSAGDEQHFMIADTTATYIVEFVNNGVSILSDVANDGYDDIPNMDTPIMTNFYMTGWDGECKLVSTGSTEAEVAATGLTNHSMGVERYSILKSALDNLSESATVNDIKTVVDMVEYTKAYDFTDPLADGIWRTECVGLGSAHDASDPNKKRDYTIYTTKSDYSAEMTSLKDDYTNRSRDTAKSWETTHCSIYDLVNKKLYIRSQLNSTEASPSMLEYTIPTA